jgi:hypothetical protein
MRDFSYYVISPVILLLLFYDNIRMVFCIYCMTVYLFFISIIVDYIILITVIITDVLSGRRINRTVCLQKIEAKI